MTRLPKHIPVEANTSTMILTLGLGEAKGERKIRRPPRGRAS